ncbi:hypothetical protein K788_00023030 [Paraburkholderia caribensis MBA4]|uniref:Uncharacterized protein n=1 Tax=Paraburkholderia caribensis MBA4 TaxID=1323664 RepID=A0A0N7JU33_9BURK|nr:hypothetical protein K788_00023030 [Paraburkholderia caribensis MBA4]
MAADSDKLNGAVNRRMARGLTQIMRGLLGVNHATT